MTASELVKYNGTSADKLGKSVFYPDFGTWLMLSTLTERILRHLATHHIFREVSPGVFAHNILSSVLDTGKDFTDIVAAYVDSLAAFIF